MGALAHDVRQHGLAAPGHHGLDLALERAHDDVGRAHAGLADVHVRIGMEAADDGGVVDDVGVDVGVHVQRHRHRRLGIDLAQAAQQVALGVFHALGHHGAVQVQQDGVVAALADLVQHPLAQQLVGLGAGRAAGPGFGGHRHHDLGADAARHLDVAAQAAVGVLVGADGAVAGQDFRIAAEKARERGRHGREGVRLVLDHCQKPTHGNSCGCQRGRGSGRSARVRRPGAAAARAAGPGACVPRRGPRAARPDRRSARRRSAGRSAGLPGYNRN